MNDTVRAWETSVEIESYGIGAPDPFPPYQHRGRMAIYPYPLLDNLTGVKAPRQYRALMLENRYLRVMALPELGGRVHQVYDKVSQRDMFYRTSVIKPALIALRGAWIAGGIEWNFRQGHHVDTMSPVAGKLVEHPDGSASAVVGHSEWVSDMRWQVEITLRPDTAALYTAVRLANPTPLAHRYYFWSTSAEVVNPQVQVICPAAGGWDSPGGRFMWPVNNGHDRQWDRNFTYPSDSFLYAPDRDFFGCYDHSTQYGLVHHADAAFSPGKKFFTWSVSDYGLRWADTLSDGDGPYIELQTSPMFDQMTWNMFPPYQSFGWEEIWWPYRQIGGFVWATRDMALNLEPKDGALRLGISAARPFGQCHVQAQADGQPLWEGQVGLAPESAFITTIALPSGVTEGAHFTATVSGSDGSTLLHYDSDQRYSKALLPPAITYPAADEMTVEELLALAARRETEAEHDQARVLYEKALAIDALCTAAHVGMARLLARQGRWPDVTMHTLRALQRNPNHAEAIYLAGLADWKLGHENAAVIRLRRLVYDATWSRPALVALGDLAVREQDWEAALRYYQGIPLTAARQSYALRQLGRGDDALKVSRAAVAADAFDRPALAEIWFASHASSDFDALNAVLLDQPEAWLETALFYLDLNALDSARAVLVYAVEHAAGQNPLVWYTLAYVYSLSGDSARREDALRRASQLPAPEIFPHRLSVLSVLDDALRARPDDARARLYRGELLYALGRRAEAEEDWKAAVKADPTLAAAHRNLAVAALQAGGERKLYPVQFLATEGWRVITAVGSGERFAEALDHYHRAVKHAPGYARLYLERDAAAEALKLDARQRLDWLREAPPDVQTDYRLAMQMAHLHTRLGEFDRAIDLMHSTVFRSWEGSMRPRYTYAEAYLGRALAAFRHGDHAAALADCQKALEYPAHIEIGRPNPSEDAALYYVAGRAAAGLNQPDMAREFWMKAVSETYPAGSPHRYHQSLAYRALGDAEHAASVIVSLDADMKASLDAEWSWLVHH